MVIYADLIFLINTVFNFLMFMVCRYIARSKINIIKITAASAFGGVYAVFESIYSISCYLRPLVLCIMCVMIWGKKDMVKNTVNTFFMIVCVEGLTILIVSHIGVDASIASGTVTVFMPKFEMFAAVAVSYVIYTLVKIYLKRSVVYKNAEITINGKKICVKVLSDSGNLLKYKNKTVMIVRYDAISSAAEASDYNSFFNHSEDFISYKTIQSEGIIPVFEPEHCRIDGSDHEIAVAVIRNGFGRNYQGIIGSL